VIERLVERARARGLSADGLWRSEERTAIAFESGRLKSAGIVEEAGTNLRVISGGRVGVAGTTAAGDAEADALLERALASAALGEQVPLSLPSAAPLPTLSIFAEPAERASVEAMVALGRGLLERVTRDGCQVNVSVEREISETRVANTAGAGGRYRATAVALSVDVIRVAGDDVLMVYDQYVGTDLPGAADVDRLVDAVTTRLELGLRVAAPPEGSLPVIFTPSGLSAILLPLEQALSGKAVLQGISPLAGKIGERRFDPRLSLTDDPLAPGRAGSRPLDDEGVPSATLPLIERGVVRGFVYDLETAARAGVRSTGNGRRGVFGKPRIGYTNLVLSANGAGKRKGGTGGLGGGLVAGVKDGLLVEDLIGVGQGNVIGGGFSHPVALAYRIENGEITGRVKDAAVAGNAYELLAKIGGVGTDGRWLSSRYSPSLLLEGVSVARR